MASENQGIVLFSHLYGRARDVCRMIADDAINYKSCVNAIVSVIHKRDSLTIFSVVYGEPMKLMTIKRMVNESFQDLEPQFNAQLSRFNSLATHAALDDYISVHTVFIVSRR